MTRVSEVYTVAEDGDGGMIVSATFQCDGCRRLSLGSAYIEYWTGPDIRPWIEDEAELSWQPAKGVSPTYEDVPDHIASAASEAHECRSINALRAAVLMARSVIEATAKEKGHTTGRLAEKIDQMADAQLIRPHVQAAAHEVRYLGNDMAHGDIVEPVSEDEADDVLILMGEVLNDVWQSPKRVERMKAVREAKRAQQQADPNATPTTPAE